MTNATKFLFLTKKSIFFLKKLDISDRLKSAKPKLKNQIKLDSIADMKDKNYFYSTMIKFLNSIKCLNRPNDVTQLQKIKFFNNFGKI